MSIFDEVKQESESAVLFNTGTPYDLMTGSYQFGINNKWYLNGGLPVAITGIHGGGNMFKSTLVDALIAGALRIYHGVEDFDIDTEGSKSKERKATFMDDPLHSLPDGSSVDISGRITIKSGTEFDINKVWEFLQEICAIKEKNRKAAQITLPFISPITGKPIVTWTPTIIFTDSLTELESSEEGEMLNSKKGIEDKKNKTIWLVDGNKKTLLIRAMRKMAEKYGIIFICSAHKGDNGTMDNSPPSKQIWTMKQSDRMKGVGSRFEFLTHVLAQVMSAKLALSSDKQSTLFGPGPRTDLNDLMLNIQRNKTNASGTMMSCIVSQTTGFLNTVTNLNFLRTNGYIGLNGGSSKPKHACVWYPEVNFSRNTIREQAVGDYALNRAIELTARYAYIRANWNLANIPFDFTQEPEAVFDRLNSNGIEMNDLLHTTGYWTYDKPPREYMSIMDIVGRACLQKSEKTISTAKTKTKVA